MSWSCDGWALVRASHFFQHRKICITPGSLRLKPVTDTNNKFYKTTNIIYIGE